MIDPVEVLRNADRYLYDTDPAINHSAYLSRHEQAVVFAVVKAINEKLNVPNLSDLRPSTEQHPAV